MLCFADDGVGGVVLCTVVKRSAEEVHQKAEPSHWCEEKAHSPVGSRGRRFPTDGLRLASRLPAMKKWACVDYSLPREKGNMCSKGRLSRRLRDLSITRARLARRPRAVSLSGFSL